MPKRLIKGIFSLCTSWVNPGVSQPVLRRRDASLIGAMFALPCVATASTLLQPSGLPQFASAVPQLSLSFALPMLAAGLLSLTGNQTIRRAISIAALPAFCLAATQGHAFQMEAMVLTGLLAGLSQRYCILEKSDLFWGGLLAAISALATPLPVFAGSVLLGMLAFAASSVSANPSPISIKNDADESLSAGEKLLASMLNASGFFVIRADRTGKILSASGLASIGFAVPVKNLVDVVHVADRVSLLTALDGASAGMAAVQTINARLNLRRSESDGFAFQTAQIMISPIDSQIMICGNVGSGESNGIEAIVSPLVQTSHEMRTPLNAIVGFSELLENGMSGELANDRQREYVELINRSGRHLLDLVNSMLEVSKLENGTSLVESTPFLPDEVATLAVNMLAHQAQSRKIGLDYMPLCVFEAFHGDRLICQQILVNLLSNAVKFTPDGGRIGLKVDICDNKLMIEVRDNGIGMSGEDLMHAGTPFFRAETALKSGPEGSGLGLSLVRRMAERHGGAMEIESEPGKGTRVRVTLLEVRRNAENPASITFLRPPVGNEAARIISISEEPIHDAPRKTA